MLSKKVINSKFIFHSIIQLLISNMTLSIYPYASLFVLIRKKRIFWASCAVFPVFPGIPDTSVPPAPQPLTPASGRGIGWVLMPMTRFDFQRNWWWYFWLDLSAEERENGQPKKAERFKNSSSPSRRQVNFITGLFCNLSGFYFFKNSLEF